MKTEERKNILAAIQRLNDGLRYGEDMLTSSEVCFEDAQNLIKNSLTSIAARIVSGYRCSGCNKLTSIDDQNEVKWDNDNNVMACSKCAKKWPDVLNKDLIP